MWIGTYVLLAIVIFLQSFILYHLLKQAKKLQNALSSHDNILPENKPESLLVMDFDEEVRRTTELQWLRIRNAIQKQTQDIHKKEMELAPREFLFSTESLSRVFNEQQMESILSFSKAYQQYLDRFWYTKNRQLKSVFKGETTDPQTEAGQLVRSSHELCHQMDLWFKNFYQNS